MITSNTTLPYKTRLEYQDIQSLIESRLEWKQAELRLSLYLPFDQIWREQKEHNILLNSLKRIACQNLENRDATPEEMEALLAPVEYVLCETDPTVFQGKGLAIFSSQQFSVILLLPVVPPAFLEIDTHFRLDYVLDSIFGRDRFYLLCLGFHSVQLWDCDGLAMEEIALQGMETDIRKMPKFETDIGLSAYPHFFQTINHGLQTLIPDRERPMILAGVGTLMALYRDVNSYLNLLPEEIIGNPEAHGITDDFHDQATALLRGLQYMEKLKLLRLFRENRGSGGTASGFQEIVPEAYHGSLTHLFIPNGQIQWGTFDMGLGRTAIHEEFTPGAIDLVNFATIYAMQSGSKVYVVHPGEIPPGCEMLALVRD